MKKNIVIMTVVIAALITVMISTQMLWLAIPLLLCGIVQVINVVIEIKALIERYRRE